MDGQRGFYEMENPTENPSKAAEYLKELNKIIETQQGLLEKQRVRIEELELQVTDLCKENACLKDQHQRHLATCRLQQGNHSSLGAIKENVMQENTAQNPSAVTLLETGSDCRIA
ncbi:IQ motif and SEC7 domain-containing protein 2 [Channa argus]|uniref:IQ motif and SEC7 domain-containing protein 2 n=1 Tax=Channa argus TaxID=215402 RepID=A0A6G1PGI6_CHAAH|nr:IQ motif and SEC7 domain-containing protein 2 [Channa argus]